MYVWAQVRLIEGAYVQLEDAYCLRSVEEAMRIAEPIEVCACNVGVQSFCRLLVGFRRLFSCFCSTLSPDSSGGVGMRTRDPSVVMCGRSLFLENKHL